MTVTHESSNIDMKNPPLVDDLLIGNDGFTYTPVNWQKGMCVVVGTDMYLCSGVVSGVPRPAAKLAGKCFQRSRLRMASPLSNYSTEIGLSGYPCIIYG